MRLPTIPPAKLSAEQRALYDDMRAGIAKSFQGFVSVGDDGALLGPWNPWLHEPHFGKPVWELTKAVADHPLLPAPVREVAILVTGAHFRSAYELYAHVVVAENRGLPDDKLACIVAGQRPADLTRQEAVAFERRLRIGQWWRAAGIDVACGGEGIRPARGGGADIPCRAVLHGFGDAERIQRPRAQVHARIVLTAVHAA